MGLKFPKNQLNRTNSSRELLELSSKLTKVPENGLKVPKNQLN